MLLRRLAFRGEIAHWMRLTSRNASDYSGTFRDKERFQEDQWVKKHEMEVASVAAERKKDMEAVAPLHSDLSEVEVAEPGTPMYSHQSNKVVALQELEEILEAFPGLSDTVPNDLKRVLVSWRVDALYCVSKGDPREFSPTVDIDGSMTINERTVLPPEYAPSWLFDSTTPLEYKLQRYAYDMMKFDYDVEPIEHNIDREDHGYKAIKKRIIARASGSSKGKDKDKDKKP